jgi:hypothetical protein
MTRLKEVAYASTAGYTGLAFNIETPASAFAAQFAAEMGLSSADALALAVLARGATDYNEGGVLAAQLQPGSAHWANVAAAMAYIKRQCGLTSAFANNPGPLLFRNGGMFLRLGEAAASSSISRAAFLAELQALLAAWNAANIDDNPHQLGAPIFAASPSQASSGTAYAFGIYAAHADMALSDRRFVLATPSFVGEYQNDVIHQTSRGNALIGAYLGKWAAWWHQGKRCAPFVMTAATMISSTVCRVTFQMPPTGSAAQATLQFYSDANLPSLANQGFSYSDQSASGVTIASVALTAGSTNQIDITLSANPTGFLNPTISLGATRSPNGKTFWTTLNANVLSHNVADSDTRTVALPGLTGNAFGGGSQLPNFANHCDIVIGTTKQTAW